MTLATLVFEGASFTANVVFSSDGTGDTSLTAYTESSAAINSFVLEANDADGFFVLPGLAITATGPSLAPSGLTGGPCTTNEYCFMHPSLPAGTDELDSFIELAAGMADQRIPVHIVRAAY